MEFSNLLENTLVVIDLYWVNVRWTLTFLLATMIAICLHYVIKKYHNRQTEREDSLSQSNQVDESSVEDISPVEDVSSQQDVHDSLICPFCKKKNCVDDHESTFLFDQEQYKEHVDVEHITLKQKHGDEDQCLAISEKINQFKQLKTVTIIGWKLAESSLSHLFQCTSIRSLKLTNCQLGNVPGTLANLKDLEILDLSHNKLTALPSRPIPLLPCLKSLIVSHNRITAIGDVVKKLQALKNLDVSHNSIKRIPYGILKMKSLEALSCSNNKIVRWLDPSNGEEQGLATSILQFLNISDNMLPDVPRHLKELKNLSVVNLSGNKIAANVSNKIVNQQISELFYLPLVSTLRLGNNKIKTLPSLDTAKVSPNLELVDLSNNKISEVPPTMLSLATLKVLLLAGNMIAKLPTDLDLNNLSPMVRVVDLSGNSLEDLPLVLCFLRSLEKLDLKQNKIRTISENMKSCKSLAFLDVSYNRLKEIPSHVIGLPNLVELQASNNQITSVSPLQSNELSVIEVIALAENGLLHFPAALIQMEKLKKVDLRSNEIQVIPQSIMGMSQGVILNLQDNPTVDPPLQVCRAGLPAIKAFYEDLTTASSITQCLKTLFLGTYEAGKTSLVKVFQLKRSCLTKPEERTHGIEIAELHLSAPNTPDITLSVWDFAGQETYYMTHQFFLSAKALMLLIVNLERYDSDNFPSTCGNWMENMIAKVGNPVVIPVATHVDKLSEEVVKDRCEDLAKKLAKQEENRIRDLERQLERIEESPLGSIEAARDRKKQIESLLQKRPSIHLKPIPVSSAESLDGIQYLKQVILNYAVNKEYFPEVGRPIPKAWADTEAFVERKGKELSFPYMTWDEFTALLEENVPNLQPVSRIQTVAQYLHDTGKILWYSEIESLRNHVFLKPASLVDIFRKVIRHDLETVINYRSEPCYREAEIAPAEFENMKIDLIRKGILHTKLLRCLWSDVEKECRPGTFDAIFDVLIELMRQFDLCYDLDEQQQVFDMFGPPKTSLLPWHYKQMLLRKAQHHVSRRLLLPWHIKEDLQERADKMWKSGENPIISIQYQFPSFFPPGLFARLTVRAHSQEHGLHSVSHWITGTLCIHKRNRTLVLLKYEDEEGHVVSLSARLESLIKLEYGSAGVPLNNLWKTLEELILEVEDLLKQWPGVRFDRVTVCPKCHRPSFPGEWLHPSSRLLEEEDVICSFCNERVPVEYLMPSPPRRRLRYDLPFVARHGQGIPYGYPYRPEQRFPGLHVSESVSDRQLLRVAKKLGSEWESLATVMGFTQADVFKFKCDHPHNTEQQIFTMLTRWRGRMGRNATGRQLQAILRRAGIDHDAISCLDEVERSSAWGAESCHDEDFY